MKLIQNIHQNTIQSKPHLRTIREAMMNCTMIVYSEQGFAFNQLMFVRFCVSSSSNCRNIEWFSHGDLPYVRENIPDLH